MFYIAIVGKPNVGKSTVYNKIVGGRPAIVDGTPGVTRDRNIAIVERGNRRFGVIDSGGFEPEAKDGIIAQVQEQTQMAVEEADVIFFMVDGKEGIAPVDEEIARHLRKASKPIFLVINKIDHPSHRDSAHDFAGLGFSEIFPVSAEHSLGVETLLTTAVNIAPEQEQDAQQDDKEAERPVKVAVVGKPNVGKSSLVNKLLATTWAWGSAGWRGETPPRRSR